MARAHSPNALMLARRPPDPVPGHVSWAVGLQPRRPCARPRDLWSLDTVDIRQHATDRHQSVDDTPSGGGPGMVMKADVLARALDCVPADGRPRLLMSPRGRP